VNDKIGQIIYQLIKYNADDTRRINHALKVYAFAKCIIECETEDERLRVICEIAAVLHDIGIHVCEEKYNSAAGKYQEIEGPAIAKELLSSVDIDADILERVLYLIAHHHTYNDIKGADYQALVEADFIVNLEEEKSGEDAILAALKNIFKTDTGKSLLITMLT